MSCPKCGSWSVKADRSLGGRMVCGRCGEPLGAQLIPLRRSRPWRWRPAAQAPRLWWLALIALVGLSGALAGLQLDENQQRSLPWEQRSLKLAPRIS